MKTIYFILIISFVFAGYVKADSTLIGVWGISPGEDANFAISTDSVYYVDNDTSCKYSVNGDSIFINMGANYIYRAKYILRNDSLILMDKMGTTKYVRFAESRTPTYSSFTMQQNFINITYGIGFNENGVSLYISFIPIVNMDIGISYLLGNISENSRPSFQVNKTYNTPGQFWYVTINTNGDVYIKNVCCTIFSSGASINIGLTYPL